MNELNLSTLGRVVISLGERVQTTKIPPKAVAVLIYGLREGRRMTGHASSQT